MFRMVLGSYLIKDSCNYYKYVITHVILGVPAEAHSMWAKHLRQCLAQTRDKVYVLVCLFLKCDGLPMWYGPLGF